jgi:hypothetical protein
MLILIGYGLQAIEHRLQISASGNIGITPRIECIEADVDAPDSGGVEVLRIPLKQAGVGRQRQILDPR